MLVFLWRVEHFKLLCDCFRQKYLIIKTLRMLQVAHEDKYAQHLEAKYLNKFALAQYIQLQLMATWSYLSTFLLFIINFPLSICSIQKTQSSERLQSNIPMWNPQTDRKSHLRCSLRKRVLIISEKSQEKSLCQDWGL